MGIVKSQSKSAAAAPTAEAQPVLIELFGVHRYVWRGVLYTQGVVYTCTPTEAEEFLAHDMEGKPVFRRYIKRAERPKVDEVPTMPVPKPSKAGKVAAQAGSQKLEIGTEEELADLNLPKATDEDTTEV